MNDNLDNPEVWEFLATAHKVTGPHGDTGHYATTDISIGDNKYENTVVATGYPLFVQLCSAEFDRLEAEHDIVDILTVQEFEQWYNQAHADEAMVREALPGSTEPLTELLDDVTSPPIIRQEPILRGSFFQLLYPFTHVGIADIEVQGRYSNKLFERRTVTRSEVIMCRSILGNRLVSLLNNCTIGTTEEMPFHIRGYLLE